jgi:3-hydroxy-9,10-secoandrosta-1,3,5(10)-triene-9,17-dione monooxygenase
MADGSIEPRFFNIPKSDIEVVDDWFTTGMRGTGSRSIRIRDAFIPAYRSCALQDMLGGTSPGAALHTRPIYRMPFADIAPFSIVGAPIGMARGGVKNFTSHIAPQLSAADELTIAEQTPKLMRLAEAAAAVDASLALVVADAQRIDAAASPSDLSAVERARIPRDWAWAAQTSRQAVSRLFEVAGGSTIYDGDALQRIWRDVNSATQHFAFSWDSAMPNYGRAAAGLKPARFTLKGRK